jgi:hypothetical protein
MHSAFLSADYHESDVDQAFSGPALRPWLVFLGLVAALAAPAALVAARPFLERASPAAEALYARVGLGDEPTVRDLVATLETGPGGVLAIEGRIDDPLGRATVLPLLRIALIGADDQEIYHWTAPAPVHSLEAGETIGFRTKLDSPPPDARKVVIRFAKPDDDSWLPGR